MAECPGEEKPSLPQDHEEAGRSAMAHRQEQDGAAVAAKVAAAEAAGAALETAGAAREMAKEPQPLQVEQTRTAAVEPAGEQEEEERGRSLLQNPAPGAGEEPASSEMQPEAMSHDIAAEKPEEKEAAPPSFFAALDQVASELRSIQETQATFSADSVEQIMQQMHAERETDSRLHSAEFDQREVGLLQIGGSLLGACHL